MSIARTARRHRLPSEASKRFERGVDPALAAAAAERGRAAARRARRRARPAPVTDVDTRGPPPVLTLPARRARAAGRPAVRARGGAPAARGRRLHGRRGDDPLEVVPPTWRPDLTGRAELVEEVAAARGLRHDPGRAADRARRPRPDGRAAAAPDGVPRAGRRRAGRGRAAAVRRASARSTRSAAAMERPRRAQPAVGGGGAAAPDACCPGLLAAVVRNVGRGLPDVAVFETGRVFLGHRRRPRRAGRGRRPTDAEVRRRSTPRCRPSRATSALAARRRAAASLGRRRRARSSTLGRALGLVARAAGRAARARTTPAACAELLLDGRRVGPRRRAAPARGRRRWGCRPAPAPPRRTSTSSSRPPRPRPAAGAGRLALPARVGRRRAGRRRERAGRRGRGGAARRAPASCSRTLRLFDVYTGPQVGEGERSLAYALRLRAPDRTLTDTEVLGARDAAVAEAERRVGRGPALVSGRPRHRRQPRPRPGGRRRRSTAGGWSVAVTGRDAGRLDESADAGAAASRCPATPPTAAAVEAAVARTEAELGPLDLLVANAGRLRARAAGVGERPGRPGGATSRSTCAASQLALWAVLPGDGRARQRPGRRAGQRHGRRSRPRAPRRYSASKAAVARLVETVGRRARRHRRHGADRQPRLRPHRHDPGFPAGFPAPTRDSPTRTTRGTRRTRCRAGPAHRPGELDALSGRFVHVTTDLDARAAAAADDQRGTLRLVPWTATA